MAEQLRVFVSHSHQDNKFCHAIVKALRDAGADVWYDEHNLGWGELHDEIQRELGRRKIFVLILSKAAFASKWVKRETSWAYNLYSRDPTRVILPVTAGQIEFSDFDPEAGWLFLDNFKRIEAPDYMPYPVDESARRLVGTFGLTPRRTTPAPRLTLPTKTPMPVVPEPSAPEPAADHETTVPVAPQPGEDVDDLLTRGQVLAAQKKFTEALPLFERATQLNPGSYSAWGNLGYVLNELQQWREALDAHDRALALHEQQAWVWTNKITALLALGREEEAMAANEQAYGLDPNIFDIWIQYGDQLTTRGRYQPAVAAYERALALNADDVHVWDKLGVALFELGRYEQSLQAYERALALAPRWAKAWDGKCAALLRLGRDDEYRAAKAEAERIRYGVTEPNIRRNIFRIFDDDR